MNIFRTEANIKNKHLCKTKLTSALLLITFVLTDPVRSLVDFSSDFSNVDFAFSNVYGVDAPERDEVGEVTPEPPLDVTEDVEGRRPSNLLSKSL